MHVETSNYFKNIGRNKVLSFVEDNVHEMLYFNMSKKYLHIFLIVVLGIIVYSNTFYVPFYYDDIPNIVENPKLRDLGNFWPPSGTRWFGFLTFALNYHFGGLSTLGYHIVNLTIHIINAILVYWLVSLTLRTPFFSNQLSAVSCQHKETSIHPFTYLPLFVALLFVSHPIQTQAVTYIYQRFTSLATMFYLLTIVMYIKGRIQQSAISNQPSAISRQKLEIFKLKAESCMLYAASLFSAVLAMKTKEIAFTLPIVIVLYEFCFFSRTPSSKLRTPNLKQFIYLLPFLFTLLIIPLDLFGPEFKIHTSESNIGDNIQKEQIIDLTTLSRYEYLLTQFRVIVTYIRLVFIPVNQTLDYDYPVYDTFFNPNVFLSFLFLLSLFGFGVYLFYRSRVTMHSSQSFNSTRYPLPAIRYTLPATRLIAFGIFWFFITLSVESSVIPILHVIFEHRVYLPSIGIIIAFSTAVFYVLHRATEQQSNRAVVKGKTAVLLRYCSTAYCLLLTAYCLLSTIIIFFSITSYMRNELWGNPVLFWRDNVKKAPEKVAPYYHLGVAYYNAGQIRDAIEAFNLASILGPGFPEIFFRKGLAYEKIGWWDDAMKEYEKTLSLNPNFKEARYNLEAIQTLKRVMKERGPAVDSY
jgi:hypothetical protein